MVEGEAPGLVVRHPAGLGRVTPAVRFGRVRQQGGEGHGHDPHAGVATGFAVGPQLLQVQPGHVRQAGLLGQLPAGGRLRRLVREQEAPGERPAARVRLLSPRDEQHVQRVRAQREDGEVDGDGEGFESVLVVAVHDRPPP